MPRYSPRTHVFDYGGTTPKVRRERFAIEEFCKRMRTHHGASYTAVRINEALRRGFVVDVDGSTVDGVLRTSGGLVAVELLGYSPQGDRGDVMARDLLLRKAIKRSLFEQLTVKNYCLTLYYREKQRDGPKFALVRTVPPSREFKKLINEIRTALTIASIVDFNQFLSVRFVNPKAAARWGLQNGTLFSDETQFPISAQYLDQIRLQKSQVPPPRVESDLKTGAIGIDEEWVTANVTSKANKSLDRSRKRANGLPLWLIIHSDGHAIHQMIHETHRETAIKLCREVLTSTKHGFDRVYWADQTGFLNSAWVGRVL